ncbi:hypothetical protein ACHAXR_012288 [Thalassiosira sp. AJA248-18]
MVLAALLFIFRESSADKFCGVSLEVAENTCWQPCSSDSDCCALAQRCFEADSCGSSDLTGTNHNFCGISWCDAAYKCGTPCPDIEGCPDGESCFADIPCDRDTPKSPPPLPNPPTSSPYQFCGSSLSAAKDNCWQPCPRGDSDCCRGLGCFDTSSDDEPGEKCSNSDYSGSNHYFCGKSWCDAAYSCQDACSGGTDDECPNGQYCYADVPCLEGQSPPPNVDAPANIFSKYCGTSEENAAENCWQPCRENDDCCFGQTCFEGVTSCPYPDNIGADHFFCGGDFCDSSYSCSEPCPTGFDAECPDLQRCIARTPCNANLRSTTASTFEFGLPRSALLVRQFRPGEIEVQAQGQTNEAPAGGNSSIGLVFGICLIILVALGAMWTRYRRS